MHSAKGIKGKTANIPVHDFLLAPCSGEGETLLVSAKTSTLYKAPTKKTTADGLSLLYLGLDNSSPSSLKPKFEVLFKDEKLQKFVELNAAEDGVPIISAFHKTKFTAEARESLENMNMLLDDKLKLEKLIVSSIEDVTKDLEKPLESPKKLPLIKK